MPRREQLDVLPARRDFNPQDSTSRTGGIMSVLKTFSEVLTAFHQLWIDLDGGILDVEIVCPGSWDTRNPPDTFRPEDVIGRIRVPVNEGLSVFSPWAEPIQIAAHRVQPAQIKVFVDLCRNAGLLLPSTRKYELRQYCDWDSQRPEELWVAHLLCLTKQHSLARLNIDVIHIRKPVQFSIDEITDWMKKESIPNEPPTPVVSEVANKPRERARLDVLNDLAMQHYRELWPIRTAIKWGRFLADKLPGRKKPIDFRTVQKLEAWKKAERRWNRSGLIHGRLEQHGVPKQFLEEIEDSTAGNFQKWIDEKLDSESQSRLRKDNDLRLLFEAQFKDMNNQKVQKDDGVT